jgi:peptide/nickel transport system substrate-binding protein
MGIIKAGHPWYPGDEIAYKYTEFNPDEANALLDGLGYTNATPKAIACCRAASAWASSSPVTTALGAYVPVAELIVGDLKDVGVWVDLQVRERDLHFQMRQANELQAEVWNQDSAGTMFSGSTKFDIRRDLYGNLTYGPLFKTGTTPTARKASSRRDDWKRYRRAAG